MPVAARSVRRKEFIIVVFLGLLILARKCCGIVCVCLFSFWNQAIARDTPDNLYLQEAGFNSLEVPHRRD